MHSVGRNTNKAYWHYLGALVAIFCMQLYCETVAPAANGNFEAVRLPSVKRIKLPNLYAVINFDCGHGVKMNHFHQHNSHALADHMHLVKHQCGVKFCDGIMNVVSSMLFILPTDNVLLNSDVGMVLFRTEVLSVGETEWKPLGHYVKCVGGTCAFMQNLYNETDGITHPYRNYSTTQSVKYGECVKHPDLFEISISGPPPKNVTKYHDCLNEDNIFDLPDKNQEVDIV